MEITITKLYSVVNDFLNFVRQDLISNVETPYNSWLYLEFHDNEIDDTNFYDQLKSIIERDDTDQRKLKVRLMFDRERANLPTFHIHYPTENGRSGDNTLGMGFESPTLTTEEDVNLYSRSFVGEYEIIVTGGNSLEVVMLYEFVDAMLIAGADTLSHLFDIYSFSGRQLSSNQELIPYLTFYRSIGMSIQAKKKVRSFVDRSYGASIEFNETTYLDEGQQPEDVLVSVSITSDATTTPYKDDVITFTAVPANGGTTPVYEWRVNGVLITSNNSDTMILNTATTGSKTAVCRCYSSIAYLLPRPATSNSVTLVLTTKPVV